VAEEEARIHPAEEEAWAVVAAKAQAEIVYARTADINHPMSVESPALRSNVPNAGLL